MTKFFKAKKKKKKLFVSNYLFFVDNIFLQTNLLNKSELNYM